MRAYAVMHSVYEDSYDVCLSKFILFKDRRTAEAVLLKDFLSDINRYENACEISYSQDEGRYSLCFDEMNYAGGMIREVEVSNIPANNDIVYLLWGYFWEYNDWDGNLYAASGIKEDMQKEMKRGYHLNLAREDMDWEQLHCDDDCTYLETTDNERYVTFVTDVKLV